MEILGVEAQQRMRNEAWLEELRITEEELQEALCECMEWEL